MLGSLNLSVKDIRTELGMSQSELASASGFSKRAIQSYEQGWRQPSELVERILLFLLIAHRNGAALSQVRCWEQKNCHEKLRGKCISYLTQQGHLCWFLTGTKCEGKHRKSWADKLATCLRCSFMQRLLNPTSGLVADR